MIIQGKVHTLEGPVDIKDLKAGDRVVDFTHRPMVVVAVKKEPVSKALVFAKNPNLIVSEKALLYTVYGKKDGSVKSAMMVLPYGGSINDEISVIEGEFCDYSIEFAGDGVFVENYCIGVIPC